MSNVPGHKNQYPFTFDSDQVALILTGMLSTVTTGTFKSPEHIARVRALVVQIQKEASGPFCAPNLAWLCTATIEKIDQYPAAPLADDDANYPSWARSGSKIKP